MDAQQKTVAAPVFYKHDETGREKQRFRETCVLVTKDARTGRVVQAIEVGPNIVTDQGDKYYAQRGAAGAVSFTFSVGNMVVAKSYKITVAAGGKTATFGKFVGLGGTYSGRATFAVGYPKTADSDTDNTGRTVDAVTYKRVYSTSQANYTIRALGICRNGGATSSNGQLLSYKTLTTAQFINKTSSLTLTVYINHTFLGT